MGRAPCCEKVGLNRGPWTQEEDMRLIHYIQAHGGGCWRTLPKAAGLLRCGKSCRLRWINYLRPDLKRGNISEEEDRLIIKLHSMLGNRWSLIAGRLPGRTDNEIKNYWNTHLKKKLRNMGIDPQTHKPIILLQQEGVNKAATSTPVVVAAEVKKQVPPFIIDQPHANNISLVTSTNQLKRPTNQLNKPTNHHHQLHSSHKDIHHTSNVINFKAKPLDHISIPSHLQHLLHFDDHDHSCPPYLTSLLSVAPHSPPPTTLTSIHIQPLTSPPSSTTSSSFEPKIPQFFSIVPHSHPEPIPNTAISYDCGARPFDASYPQSSSLPWPSSFSPIGTTTPCPSSSSSLSTSSSSSSASTLPSFWTDAQPSEPIKDNTCYAYVEDTKNVTLATQDNVGRKMPTGNIHKGDGDSNNQDDVGAQSLTECELSLMDGELMWDMEMIHSFQEVGTPTTSSMPTCSSSCNLWGHDVACCNNASPLQAWLNVGNIDHTQLV